jgi:hypothetical protein
VPADRLVVVAVDAEVDLCGATDADPGVRLAQRADLQAPRRIGAELPGDATGECELAGQRGSETPRDSRSQRRRGGPRGRTAVARQTVGEPTVEATALDASAVALDELVVTVCQRREQPPYDRLVVRGRVGVVDDDEVGDGLALSTRRRPGRRPSSR